MKKLLFAMILTMAILFTVSLAEEGKIVLPASLKEIEAEAFMDDTFISEVILPDGLEIIGEKAFANSSVERIYLPDSITYIAPKAFDGCAAVVGYGQGNEYVQSYFDENDNLSFEEIWHESSTGDFSFNVLSDRTCAVSKYNGNSEIVVIPQYDASGHRVTKIEESAFAWCRNMKSITIPNSITSIGAIAFNYCSSLSKIVIPNSITSIGDGAFSGCSGLINITIPASVTSIGNQAFDSCIDLESINVSPDNLIYSSQEGILYDKGKTTLIRCPCGKMGSSLIIPSSVTRIADFAFDNCYKLLNISIPKSVTEIGDSAFKNCRFTYITIPDSITSIGNFAFYGCGELLSISIPDSITSISDFAFANCWQLQSIIIPNSVASINWAAFDGCSSLTTITLPDSITWIGGCAFEGCSSLENITIPSKVTSIEQKTFKSCYSLINFTIPDNIISIGESAFKDCSGLMNITIPNSVCNIADNAFYRYYSFGKPTIHGMKGSYVETYANTRGFPFSAINEEISQKVHGDFEQRTTIIHSNDSLQVSGTVQAEDLLLSRISLTIDGYNIEGDDNDRYATVDLSGLGLSEINLADYPSLCLDTARAPLNVPGTYTVNLWASVEGSDKGQLLDSMTVTVEAAGTVTLSGKTVTASGAPISDALAIVANSAIPDTTLAVTYTDKNGNWSVSGLKADIDYIASYWHSDYTFDTTSTNPSGAAVIGTLCGEDNGVNISFTMSQNGQEVSSTVVGTAVDFAIDAPGASYVRLVVDGTAYEEYMLDNDGQGLFSRVFSQAGARQVAFQVIKQGEYEYGTACSAKPLTVTGSDGSTDVAALPAATISAIADQIVGEDFDISWSQVENADKYHVYLYSGNFPMWDKEVLGGINTAVTVPGIDFDGTYTVVIMASGYGYNQSEASATVKVNKTGEALVIANANDIKSSVLGGSAFVEVNSVHPDLYKKLIITDPDNITTESDATQASQIYIDYHKTGTYYIRAIASNDINFNDSTALYTTDVVSIAVDTNPRIDYVTHDGKKGTYGLHYDTEDMPITVRNTFVADSVAVYEGDTLICEGVRSTTDNFWYAFDCVMPKEKLGEGKHTLTIKSYFNDAEGKPQLIDDYDYVAYIIDYVEDGTQYYLGVADRLLTSAPDLNDGFNKAAGTPVKLHGNYGTQKYVELGKGTYGFVSAELKNEWIVEEPDIAAPIIDPEKIEVYSNGELAKRSPLNSGDLPIWNAPDTSDLIIKLYPETQIEHLGIMGFYTSADGIIEKIEDKLDIKWDEGIVIVPYSYITGKAGTYYFGFSTHESEYPTEMLMIIVYQSINEGYLVYPNIENVNVYCNANNKSYLISSGVTIPWDSQRGIYVIGQIENDWLYIYYDNNDEATWGYIKKSEVNTERTQERKKGYIIIGEDMANDGGTVLCSELAKNAARKMMKSAGFDITEYTNENVRQLEQRMWYIINTSRYNDKTVIYLLSHGDVVNGIYGIAGEAPETIDDEYNMEQYCQRLSQIKGKVIVIQETCHSGYITYYMEQHQDQFPFDRFSVITACEMSEVTGLYRGGLYDEDNNFSFSFCPVLIEAFQRGIEKKNEYEHVGDNLLSVMEVSRKNGALKSVAGTVYGFYQHPTIYGSDIGIFAYK